MLADVRNCTLCAGNLPLGPRPIVQLDPKAKILVVGQAPGRKVHDSGIPFHDASGDRLRVWMGIGPDSFYDPTCLALVPMGFCYPGAGPSGDLPPRPECAAAWRAKVLDQLEGVQLTLVIGQYAQRYHLPSSGPSVTDTVKSWRDHWPAMVPMPHPSPRNNIWLKKNAWFEEELVPELQQRVSGILADTNSVSSTLRISEGQ
ncbi:MAG: uracil-DNA glycosylase family protein [Acidimicrobiales bacterium]